MTQALYLRNPDDRARWAAAGFDLDASDARYEALLASLDDSWEDQDRLDAWLDAENAAARAAGVPEDDDTFTRLQFVVKHINPVTDFEVL